MSKSFKFSGGRSYGKSRYNYDGNRSITSSTTAKSTTDEGATSLSYYVTALNSSTSANIASVNDSSINAGDLNAGSIGASELTADNITVSGKITIDNEFEAFSAAVGETLTVGSTFSVNNNIIAVTGSNLTLRPGANQKVIIDGNLDIQGILTRVRTTDIVFSDPVLSIGYYDPDVDTFPNE